MEIDSEKLLKNAIADAIRDGLKSKFSSSYNNPLDEMVKASIAKNSQEFTKILDDSLKSCLSDEEFRSSIRTSVRTSLSKTLVARFGGELEKQVNVLKSDPSTRARITLAIEEIVRSKTA